MLNSEEIKRNAINIGFQDCGIARAEFLKDESQLFRNSLTENKHAKMAFLERNIDARFNPESLLPNCKTVVVVTYNYLTTDSQNTNKYLIAKYAHIEDYHIVVKELLERLSEIILAKYPTIRYSITVDSSAISEKNWAMRSGVGCYGKNGLIHNKYGSYFVLGTLLLDCFCDEYDKPLRKSDCGNCNLCVINCPTNALETPYLVNANKCISYLNTEDKNPNYNELAKQKFIFGCDICQDVCPKNKKNIVNELNETKTSLFLPLKNSDYENLNLEEFSRYFSKTSILRRNFQRFQKIIEAKKQE